MGCGVSAEIHLRIKIDKDGPDKHPNIEPLCLSEAKRLLGKDNVGGYMFDNPKTVTCTACAILMERDKLTLDKQN